MIIMKRFKRWIRTRVFKLVSVLDILEYANEHRDTGLCYSFLDACCHYNVSRSEFLDKCKEFNRDSAQAFNGRNYPWWWDPGDWTTGREAYLHYLIDYYKKIKPIYLHCY